MCYFNLVTESTFGSMSIYMEGGTSSSIKFGLPQVGTLTNLLFYLLNIHFNFFSKDKHASFLWI